MDRANDPMTIQHGGSHYKGLVIEPFEMSLANHYDGAIHSILKYVTRHAAKGGAEDLWKAHHITDIRRVQVAKYGAAASRQVIPMARYIEANRIDEKEAAILRNVEFWATRPGHNLSLESAASVIRQQIEGLIALRYPNSQTGRRV